MEGGVLWGTPSPHERVDSQGIKLVMEEHFQLSVVGRLI